MTRPFSAMNETAGDIPVISVVTPSCNQGEFLAETIESVMRQAGNFRLDYIIVDGGSKDSSIDIIEHYDALLQRGEWEVRCREIAFRWMSGKDKGQTDALMKGFRMARGGIFAWLNSDDTYLPGALQAAADFFRDHADTALMYGDADYCDAAGSFIGSYKTDAFDLEKLASANIICQPAAFFRREAFEEVGGLDEMLDFAMDYDLWIRIGRQFPCRYIPGLLATYRLHGTSKTVSSDTLIRNSEEVLAVAIRHFDWAPLTRVYTSCSIRCEARLPELLARHRMVLSAAAIACSILRSLWLNKGLRRNDLKLLNRGNFSKLLRSRRELMTGGTP